MSKNKNSQNILRRYDEPYPDENFSEEAARAHVDSTQQDKILERLETLHEDFATEANQLTAQADETEVRLWRMRASAQSLRMAAEGVAAAIQEFRAEWDKATKRLKERDELRSAPKSADENSSSAFSREPRR